MLTQHTYEPRGHNSKEQMITLGSKVKDTLTGIEGTAIARTEWLHGCVRITIQPYGVDKDNKPLGSHTTDEQNVEIVQPLETPKVKTGGPRAHGAPGVLRVL